MCEPHMPIQSFFIDAILKLERDIVAFTMFGVMEHIFHLHSLLKLSGNSATAKLRIYTIKLKLDNVLFDEY